jgi:hypothetical protein
LESLGYAHDYVKPPNILFDNQDQLELVDFDHALSTGDNLDVGYEPYVRASKSGQTGGTHGITGPVTEQFDLGSIFWYMSRGTEHCYELEGLEQVNQLIDTQFPVDAVFPQRKDLPSTDNIWIGPIIERRWTKGSFRNAYELLDALDSVTLQYTATDPSIQTNNCAPGVSNFSDARLASRVLN